MIFKEKNITQYASGHRIILIVFLCLFGLCIPATSNAQKHKGKVDEKVYLEHADELMYDEFLRPGVQIVKGKVRFRYDGTILTCDSAYFNQDQNTFDAFGHVYMKGRNGVSLSCSRARYNGPTQLIEARTNVYLKEPGRYIHTDSLNYNRATNYGNYWGSWGGKIVANDMTITSKRGEYFGDTRKANAYEDVVVHSKKYTIYTNTLNYDFNTGEAHIFGPSTILTQGNTIKTNEGYYYPRTDRMELKGPSTIKSKERDISGDTLNYNSSTGESDGHGHVVIEDKLNDRTIKGDNVRYSSKKRTGRGIGNVVFVDRKNRNAMWADYVDYTDESAIAYGHALAKDFSQRDTMFIHADTLRMRAWNVKTDSVYRRIYGINNVRAYRTDVQAVCGLFIGNSRDSLVTLYRDPILWQGARQLLGDSIKVYMNDSTMREAHVLGHAMSIELMNDQKHYNQLKSKTMHAYFVDGKLRWGEAIEQVTAVYYPINDKDSSLIGLNYMETDTMRMYLSPERKLEKIWTPKVNGTMYPMTQIPADKFFLRGFAWYDYIRPKDKYDLFRIVKKGDR
jgi:lipopolysaccharide export system protein LptA